MKINAMEMDIILHGLFDPMKEKVGKCTSGKGIWNNVTRKMLLVRTKTISLV